MNHKLKLFLCLFPLAGLFFGGTVLINNMFKTGAPTGFMSFVVIVIAIIIFASLMLIIYLIDQLGKKNKEVKKNE